MKIPLQGLGANSAGVQTTCFLRHEAGALVGQTLWLSMVDVNALPVPELLDIFSKANAISILALAALLLLIGESGKGSTVPMF